MNRPARIARPLGAAIVLAASVALALTITRIDNDSSHAARIAHKRPIVKTRMVGHQTQTIGYSVRRRPIRAIVVGNFHSPRSVLVVGCIHGNEQAGIAVANRLGRARPADLALWIVPVLNPDGVAAGTRQNAHDVDLNRNFPYRWRELGSPGYLQYSGPHPLSEPEAQAAAELILRVRPKITVWFHQPLGVVDLSGGDAAVERRFARLVGLPTRRLTRYPGSAAGWENLRLPGTTAFVVELPPGPLSRPNTTRYAAAILRLADTERRRFSAGAPEWLGRAGSPRRAGDGSPWPRRP